MARKLAAPSPPSPQTPAAPPPTRVIHDSAVHPLSEWGQILGLPKHCLKREARLGRLRVAKRAGRLWAVGSWIIEWIMNGEIHRRKRSGTDEANGPLASQGNGQEI